MLIIKQLLNPTLDVHTNNELLTAVRLLVSEDDCLGRFVFGRQLPKPSKKQATKETSTSALLRSGGGGDNAKGRLQAVLVRAGHQAPLYKTRQVKNNTFRSAVIFNELQFVGEPCNSKKSAEKDAAAKALEWLMGERQLPTEDIDHMSMLLKKRKRKSGKRT